MRPPPPQYDHALKKDIVSFDIVKLHFDTVNRFCFSDFAWTYYLTLKTSLHQNFSYIAKFNMATRGQISKINQIWPHKSHFGSAFGSRSSDLNRSLHGHTTWPKTKSAHKFLIYCKIQDGHHGSKVQNRPNLTPQIIFPLGIWISFIRFGQNLAWTYFLTIQTSLRKNLSVSTKSKVAAAGGQRSKIDQIWPHKWHFRSAFGSRLSDLDKVLHPTNTFVHEFLI